MNNYMIDLHEYVIGPVNIAIRFCCSTSSETKTKFCYASGNQTQTGPNVWP